MLRIIRSRGLGIAAALIVAMGASSAYAACSGQSDMTAYHMRQLQTDLMVASLNCSLHDRYNAFIERFDRELKRNGKHLKTNFQQRFGGDALALLNAYVTTLANLSSIDSVNVGSRYCSKSKKSFDKILTVPRADIEGFADAWWDSKREVPVTDCRYDIHVASSN